MNFTIDNIIDAIAKYDNDTVEKYTTSNNNKIHNNMSLLEIALFHHNFHAFANLHNLVELEDKNDYFIHSLSCLPIALFLLETHSEYFKTQNNMVNLHQNKYSVNEGFFTEESKLPRYYEDQEHHNNKEEFTSLLLKHVLNTQVFNDSNAEVLDYILKNRNELGIKDEVIIQYIVENNYAVYQECYDEAEPISGYDLETKEKLENMIGLLIENSIDCTSDINGYLIQLVSFNKLDEMSEILTSLVTLGSNVSGFLDRIENSENWLTPEEEDELQSYDYNQDRNYDIYKKFDTINRIDQKYMDFCQLLKNYINLDNKIPNKEEVSTPKLKI